MSAQYRKLGSLSEAEIAEIVPKIIDRFHKDNHFIEDPADPYFVNAWAAEQQRNLGVEDVDIIAKHVNARVKAGGKVEKSGKSVLAEDVYVGDYMHPLLEKDTELAGLLNDKRGGKHWVYILPSGDLLVIEESGLPYFINKTSAQTLKAKLHSTIQRR